MDECSVGEENGHSGAALATQTVQVLSKLAGNFISSYAAADAREQFRGNNAGNTGPKPQVCRGSGQTGHSLQRVAISRPGRSIVGPCLTRHQPRCEPDAGSLTSWTWPVSVFFSVSFSFALQRADIRLMAVTVFSTSARRARTGEPKCIRECSSMWVWAGHWTMHSLQSGRPSAALGDVPECAQ